MPDICLALLLLGYNDLYDLMLKTLICELSRADVLLRVEILGLKDVSHWPG